MAADPAPTPDPLLVEAVARRVLALLREQPPGSAPDELLTVAEIAARCRVRPSWVYAHQRELGVIRLGDGPKARLRFDGQVVAAVLDRHRHAGRRRGADHRPRPVVIEPDTLAALRDAIFAQAERAAEPRPLRFPSEPRWG